MSSNIEIQRICKHCEQEFTARTTTTKYCSHKCGQRAYKARKRAETIEQSNIDTKKAKQYPIEELKAKEFLTVREVSQLLNCSIRSVYLYVENGTIAAVNLGQRMTRIKRSEVDKLFKTNAVNEKVQEVKPVTYEIGDCYTLTEVKYKFKISESTVQQIIKRNSIPKMRKGWFAYVPKKIIDEILT